MKCWGDDNDGQATPPPSVDGTSGTASAIAAGAYHSCAIQSGSGAVVCWGNDDNGQAMPPAVTASEIALGAYHGCAIESGSGAVLCWGSDGDGQSTPPASVNGPASAIAAGGSHSLAILAPEPDQLLQAAVALGLLAAQRWRRRAHTHPAPTEPAH